MDRPIFRLHLSEREAYLRIGVARVSRKHPMLLAMLADGRLHLTAIAMLAPHLTRENRDGLLERAIHRSKRQLEELIAEIAPRPDVPAIVRKVPERRPRPAVVPVADPDRVSGARLGLRPDVVVAPDRADEPVAEFASTGAPSVLASPPSPPVVQPLAPGRYKVQFTASGEFRDKLERLRALMASSVGNGDLAAVIEQAVTEKLERLEARRFARTRAPRQASAEIASAPAPDRSPTSRHIPAAIRRAVHERDGERCGFVDELGRRCPERGRLEFHHRHPFGLGGEHSVTNVGLVCRAHNAYLAECDYGRASMALHRRPPEDSALPAAE
jgi:hypothetical protein